MLRLIAGLEEASDGAIELDGEDVTSRTASERGLAMVFQSYALYPHKTVQENVAFPLRVAGMGKEQAEAEVDRAAEVLQLTPLLDRKPKELSGASANVLPLAVVLCATLRHFYLMNLCQIWMLRCALKCVCKLPNCIPATQGNHGLCDP